MTGGQVAPTTFQDVRTATTPYGNTEPPFDLCKLAETAGATFVSRWTTNEPRRTIGALKRAIRHRGFALVEIITQCPTYFGRRAVGSGKPVDGVEWIKENSVTARQAAAMSGDKREGKFILGNFVAREAPAFAGSSLYYDGGGE
jgi:2-oxoglutarate ferredoxin oxidoreductase subunit beta